MNWQPFSSLLPFKQESFYLFWMENVNVPVIRRGSDITPQLLLSLEGCQGYELEPPSVRIKTTNKPPIKEEPVVFTDDQLSALEKIKSWLSIPASELNASNRAFVFKGVAGSGKTFLLKHIIKTFPQLDWHLTAPTNKAAKEIEKATGLPSTTIHSKLGLVMKATQSEAMELTDSNKPLPFYEKSVLVIDESSMNGKELVDHIWRKTGPTFGYNLRVLFLGDPAQLPPVGEKKTKSWSLASPENSTSMTQVKRFDNQLLTLSVRTRQQMRDKNWSNPILDDNDDNGGVFVLRGKTFRDHILENTTLDYFQEHKVLAWRNKTVNQWNKLIREELGFKDDFNSGDLILMASPMTIDSKSIHVDDEFKIMHADQDELKTNNRVIPTWILKAKNDEFTTTLRVPVDIRDLDDLLAKLASDARSAKGYQVKVCWQKFWEVKELFQNVRFAYAMTTHRSQGSTYQGVYVDTIDTMANPEKLESFKCLYVEATRPRTHLWSNA